MRIKKNPMTFAESSEFEHIIILSNTEENINMVILIPHQTATINLSNMHNRVKTSLNVRKTGFINSINRAYKTKTSSARSINRFGFHNSKLCSKRSKEIRHSKDSRLMSREAFKIAMSNIMLSCMLHQSVREL